MKNALISLSVMAMTALAGNAQSVDGATYMLPKTGVKLTMLVEKTVYTPGDLAEYANHFLRDAEVDVNPKTSYRLVSGSTALYAEGDTSKIFTAHIDPKHCIQQLELKDGILQAINAEPVKTTAAKPFVPAYQPRPIDPKRYLSQDVLSAGSKRKMAEMVAKEIYDIRESRSELTKGQAEYMPKDGEQLRLMLASLDQQEAALRQLFQGTVRTDTTEVTLSYMPVKGVNEAVLFRFSERYGLVAADDLSGEPYKVIVEDLHIAPQPIVEPGKKAAKDETGVWINLPGKIRLSAVDPHQRVFQQIEYSAGQYGEVENLNEPLFMKKVTTHLVLNPYNGGIESIDSAPNK